jgi:hypothetical protein
MAQTSPPAHHICASGHEEDVHSAMGVRALQYLMHWSAAEAAVILVEL